MSRRKNIGKYLSIEASEDESEMESEDIDDIGEERSSVPHTSIAQQLEQKYIKAFKDIKDDEYEEEELEEGESVVQSQLLPRINSPRLFLVRVKRGAEKDIGLRILANNPNICSLVVKDGLRGYLYIEAFQKQQVLDSFGKVRGINKNRISIVPQEEMVDALTYRSDFKNIEFGRIRKGKYKGDLVSILDNDGDMVTVRIIPRINGVKKLFNPEEYQNEAIKKDRNTCIYKHDVYVNGFLEKEVLKSVIDFEAEPNFEELELFHIRKVFEVGDKVRITKGELVGLGGTVRNVMGNNITIQTDAKTDSKQYEVSSGSLNKYYDVGESVCYNGENGVITNYSDGIYFVAIKDFTEEVKVTIDKLSKPIPLTKEILRKEKPKQIFRKDGLINKQVQIKRGKFKGHTGVVKDVYMNKCRVQVNSNLTFVTVGREEIIEVVKNPQIEYVNEYTQPYSAEMHKTPAYAFESIRTDTLETPRVVDTTSLYAGILIEVKGRILKVEEYIGTTFFTSEGSFDRNEVEFVRPSKNEDVVIMEGDYKGFMAHVLDVRDDLCIVKIKNGLIKNLSLSYVCKQE